MQTVKSLSELDSVRAYLTRIGAEPRSLRVAVIKESHGKYWKDIAQVWFSREGVVTASSDQFLPTDTEASLIKVDFCRVRWPELKPIMRAIRPPKMIEEADPKDVFEFRNESGEITFIQVRVQDEKSGKRYIPWTYWDDDEWRCTEPEGHLPLYNLDKIRQSTTVFIHEGAKAARRMQTLADGVTLEDKSARALHPWGDELVGAVHLGWVGGALSPYRTDWSVLAKAGVKRVYIVADNDNPGRAAVPAIARHIRCPTFTVQFTDEFPISFDLGDDFPERMFRSLDEARYYVGPSFRDCIHPATWATDLVPNPKGKPSYVLRDSFKSMWAYIEETDTFVCTEMPDVMRQAQILNNMLAPFSHASDTCKLIVATYRGRNVKLCYAPDQKELIVTHHGATAINRHVPGSIRSRTGDPGPWLEFLSYMFPREIERRNIERWIATLVARPTVRMKYGLLLITETQGVGKNTLGNNILAPLVGYANTSFPGEADILSNFNSWLVNKRLVIISEIYGGGSWRSYNKMKSFLTDGDIEVNEKYMRPYRVDNWAHFIACSNSRRALKMEKDDRRWFYPEMTELPWTLEKFSWLRNWIERGGLSIIKHWAENYGSYVSPGEKAPMTDRKLEMIDGSRSEAQQEVANLAEMVHDWERPIVFLLKDVVAWVRNSVHEKVFDTDYELRRTMDEMGCKTFEARVKVAGNLHYLIMNPSARDKVARAGDDKEAVALLRTWIRKPQEVVEEGM